MEAKSVDVGVEVRVKVEGAEEEAEGGGGETGREPTSGGSMSCSSPP